MNNEQLTMNNFGKTPSGSNSLKRLTLNAYTLNQDWLLAHRAPVGELVIGSWWWLALCPP